MQRVNAVRERDAEIWVCMCVPEFRNFVAFYGALRFRADFF